jgi:hypothetical protein
MEPYLKTKRNSLDVSRITSTWLDPNPQPAPTINEGADSWNEFLSGWKNPRHRQQIGDHESAGTPMSAETRNVKGSIKAYARVDYYANVANPNQTHRRNYGIAYLSSRFASPTSLDIRAASNDAVLAYLQDARNQMRSLQGGVVMGELKKTLTMIANPSRRFRRRIDEYVWLARKRAKQAKRYATQAHLSRPQERKHVERALSDTWLEASFGFRPLISDTKDAAEALAESINRFKGQYAPCFGYAKREASISLGGDPTIVQIPVNDIRYLINREAHALAESRLKGQVALEFDNPLSMRMDLFGFSLSDFVPTVWELIPYSWLIDYFTNVGDVLSAWTFPMDRLKWTNQTHRLHRYLRVAGGMIPPSSFLSSSARVVSSYGDSLNYESNIKTVIREPVNPSLPSLGLRLPGLSTKWINLFALGRSRRVF